MKRLTKSQRDAILAEVDKLVLAAERNELEHAAKKDIIVTTKASADVKEQGEVARLCAIIQRRRIQKLLIQLNS